jgi:hypothetical protein
MSAFDLKRLFRIPTPAQRLAGLNLRPDLARAAVTVLSDDRIHHEVQQLQLSLVESESVIALVEGRRHRRLGLLALTTQRLLFRPHGSMPGHADTLIVEAISVVEDDVKGMTSRVVVHAADSIFEVDKILGTQARDFAEAVRGQLAAPEPMPEHDPVNELLELRARRVAGTISESDFQAAKIRLLDEL